MHRPAWVTAWSDEPQLFLLGGQIPLVTQSQGPLPPIKFSERRLGGSPLIKFHEWRRGGLRQLNLLSTGGGPDD